ncbi:MAG: NAD(P)/FAD-dependent oxidoreductase [Clostridia bacterium]|nr:NAD(P)/FAD-dependent oxidoreductase [Clostridia bacterium]
MRKILVCGAGHGGLAASIILAENGFEVTVLEKAENEIMIGHEWEDRFDFSNLTGILGIKEEDLPDDIWRYRGNSVFLSPSKKTGVEISFSGDNRQKIMWRKPLISLLIKKAKESGVKILYEITVNGPVIKNGRVTGVETTDGTFSGDLIIDSCGVFSVLRMNLPREYGIECKPKYGDLFYARRAYYDKCEDVIPDYPFEVYLYHEKEQGLSWLCTNKNSVDILIGRVYELTDEKINEQLEIFRNEHPWTGKTILNGGQRAVIPVRRSLPLMIADGYAAVGDSAFMTMPMNGMGIDLSLNAGKLLADTLINHRNEEFNNEVLWEYNRNFHIRYGCEAAKNDGLKCAILSLPPEGVDFLFDNKIIQSSDLAGGGRNISFSTLMGKFVRGMKKPGYFFTLLKGLIHGAAVSKLYKNPPVKYNLEEISRWDEKIRRKDIKIDN